VNLLWQIDAVRRFIDPTSTKRPQATLTETVISMVPVYLVIVFSLVSIVMYPFAIAGMEIFNGPESLAGVVRCSDAGVLNYDVYARFCDLTTALTSLFQCLVTSNWHVQMYDAMGKMSEFAASCAHCNGRPPLTCKLRRTRRWCVLCVFLGLHPLLDDQPSLGRFHRRLQQAPSGRRR
jgi:hypothetical protein